MNSSILHGFETWLQRASNTAGQRDRGAGLVLLFIVMFVVIGGALVMLARDTNERIGARSAAQSISFQAARAGAQQLESAVLRGGVVPLIDRSAAKREATAVVNELCVTFFGDDVETEFSEPVVFDSAANCIPTFAGNPEGPLSQFEVTVTIEIEGQAASSATSTVEAIRQ